MSFQFIPKAYYQMPVSFGPHPVCFDKDTYEFKLFQPADTEVLSVWFESNPAQLEALLPPGFKLNDPAVNVMACEFSNIGFLAGRTYRLIQISVPAHFDGLEDHVDGDFCLALFENHADPIIGGREGMGYSKIYADIPRYTKNEGVYTATASSWDFKFMKLTLDTNKPANDADRMKMIAGKSQGKMNYKYIPGTGKEADPDVSYPVFNPTAWVKPADYKWELKTPQIQICDGSIEFYSPTWEECPVHYRLAKCFSEWEIKSIIGAQHTLCSNPCDHINSKALK